VKLRWRRPTGHDINCQQAVALVTAYLDGALPRGDRERLEAHLADCPHCAEHLKQIKVTIIATGEVRADDLDPLAREDLHAAMRMRQRNTGLRVCGSLFYGDWHFISSRSFWPHSGFVPESLRLKVFNQAEDPQETQALSRFFADAYLRYRFTAGLDELQSLGEDAQRRFRSTQEINYEFDPDTLEHLKALGYVE